jgi:N-acyl-D-aspartate/D-glutamate deacylase
VGRFSQESVDLMIDLSLAARRPINWNLLAPSSSDPGMPEAQLGASDQAKARGAKIIGLTVPQAIKARVNFTSGFAFDTIPDWPPLFGLPQGERKKAMMDPSYREKLRKGSENVGVAMQAMADFERMAVEETFLPKNKELEGRALGELARERGTTAFDLMLDLSVEEDLRTSFSPYLPNQHDDETWQMRADAWRDPRTVIGASDAGAHLDMLDTFAFSTQVLGGGVRERSLLTWEEAVHQLTDVPARLYGLRERGQLQEGWHADVVVFDPETVGCGPTYTRFDLPGDAARLYADAIGIEHVFVNGVEIIRGQEFRGVFPGTVLRSGRDTDTVEVPGDGSN